MNRKTRRTLDAKQRKGEKPLTPVQEVQQQVSDLVGGKTNPQNPTVEYLVTRFREARLEAEQVSGNLRQLDAQAAQLRKRLGELTGQLQGYTKDMEVWVTKTNQPLLEEGKTYGPALAPAPSSAPAKT